MRTEAALTLLIAALLSQVGPPSTAPAAREEAYRANNLGVALLEQFRPQEAVEAFREALKIDPRLGLAQINLAIALYNVPDLPQAEKEARAAAQTTPEAPQPHYILGLIARGSQNHVAEARAAFQRVLAMDPRDVGSLINLGQLHLQEHTYPEAIAALRAALEVEPYNATAVYNLGLALTRAGQPEEGQRMMERFRSLREGGYGTFIGQSYPDQGRYAEAIVSTGSEAELVDAAVPAVRFVDATADVLPAPVSGPAGGLLARAPVREGAITLFDYDSDGWLDLLEVGPLGQRLYQNQQGKLLDVTQRLGLDPAQGGTGAVAGDYDNDGRPDLFVLRPGRSTLHHNDSGRGFSDVTALAQIPADSSPLVAAAFVDFDHDGDLDLLLGGTGEQAVAVGSGPTAQASSRSPNRLLQNSGNGTFKDVAVQAGLAGAPAHVLGVVPTDYDNRRDVDLLVIPQGEAPQLFRNMRDGTFRDVAQDVGLPRTGSGFRCVGAADVNKDGFTDFFLGGTSAGDVLTLSDGRGRFVVSAAPGESSGTSAAQFLDYDNDGLLDLLTLSNRGARLFRNLGQKWVDVTSSALAGEPKAASFAAGDLDGDGDVDLAFRLPSGELRIWRNREGNRNSSLRLELKGVVSNRSGVGAKIEMRAGSLWQKLETYAATPPPAPAGIVFGLGKRERADAVRVLWPAGVLQTELPSPPAPAPAPSRGGTVTARMMVIKEDDRKPSSCPYLYAWNGRRFEFVTDFMGGGELGYWVGPGVWNDPDPEEYVRLRDDQLKPREGLYELRVTNELEEALFVDRLRLLVVAHPADVEVIPDEGLRGPPRSSFRIYASRKAQPPRSAIDDHGHDVLSRVARLDRQHPDDFGLHPIRGYAEKHTLTLDLGEAPGRALLLLTGWTDYAFSSNNVAAHQAGLHMKPPALQVEDEQRRWVTVLPDLGIPVGRPQTLVADLTEKWRGPSRRVRVVTNMRIYWDQILVDTAGVETPLQTTILEPRSAQLRERGFSAEISPDGREPYGYDYERVSSRSPWKLLPGRYTREGDVRELIRASDDVFVVSRPGDEIALSFDATALPALPEGWRRTFLLHADGYSKEMDINSATPYSVDPLPFHAMTGYPYRWPESYPLTSQRQEYIDRYNTRIVATPLPPLELAFSEAFSFNRVGDQGQRNR